MTTKEEYLLSVDLILTISQIGCSADQFNLFFKQLTLLVYT